VHLVSFVESFHVHLVPGMRIRSPHSLDSSQGQSPNYVKIPESLSRIYAAAFVFYVFVAVPSFY